MFQDCVRIRLLMGFWKEGVVKTDRLFVHLILVFVSIKYTDLRNYRQACYMFYMTAKRQQRCNQKAYIEGGIIK